MLLDAVRDPLISSRLSLRLQKNLPANRNSHFQLHHPPFLARQTERDRQPDNREGHLMRDYRNYFE